MRIALVDPSRTTRTALTQTLQARGHVAIPFADGAEALSLLAKDPKLSALITATELQSMSGAELCWQARLLAGHQRPLYILLMSSNSERDDLINALDCGADDFISKPPVSEELYARLRTAERSVEMQTELVRLALTDSLTGLLNRRGFFEKASNACDSLEDGSSLSVVLLDIDDFKEVNDLYGHHIGDVAIQALASEVMEEQPLAGRLGGDEFCVMLPNFALGAARLFAETLRDRFAGLKLKTRDGCVHLTCSLGVAEVQAGDTVDTLIARADGALYAAKRKGRNRVEGPPDANWILENPRKGTITARAQTRSGPGLPEGRCDVGFPQSKSWLK